MTVPIPIRLTTFYFSSGYIPVDAKNCVDPWLCPIYISLLLFVYVKTESIKVGWSYYTKWSNEKFQ